jgi:hypothetical protein
VVTFSWLNKLIRVVLSPGKDIDVVIKDNLITVACSGCKRKDPKLPAGENPFASDHIHFAVLLYVMYCDCFS